MKILKSEPTAPRVPRRSPIQVLTMLLTFGDRTRTGVFFSMIWPLTLAFVKCSIFKELLYIPKAIYYIDYIIYVYRQEKTQGNEYQMFFCAAVLMLMGNFWPLKLQLCYYIVFHIHSSDS